MIFAAQHPMKIFVGRLKLPFMMQGYGIDIIFRKSVTACSILLNDIYYCKYDGTGYALRFGGVLSYFMFRMSILCGGFLCLRTYFVTLDAKM